MTQPDPNWHKYFEPNTNNQVLKNKFAIKEVKELQRVEKLLADNRIEDTPQVEFSLKGLQDIHRHIFGDLYEWAGEIREVAIRKNALIGFTRPEFIRQQADELFAQLKQDDFLQGLSRTDFAIKVADLFGEFNTLHPFREGNGRTQREFIRQLTEASGHEIDFTYVTNERMIQASEEFLLRKPEKMRRLMMEITDPSAVALSMSFHDFVIRENGVKAWNTTYMSNTTDGQVYMGRFLGQNTVNFSVLTQRNEVFIGDVKHLQNARRQGIDIKVVVLNPTDFLAVAQYRRKLSTALQDEPEFLQKQRHSLMNLLPYFADARLDASALSSLTPQEDLAVVFGLPFV